LSLQHLRNNKKLPKIARVKHTGEFPVYCAQPSASCLFDDVTSLPLTGLQSWITLPVGNEAAMMLALATIGPLAAAVDASATTFQVETLKLLID
jgi:hypothetical protein